MHTQTTIPTGSKEEIYRELLPQMRELISGESDIVANLANVSALLKMAFATISWVGFYLMKDGELVLGPFQGKPACIRIAIGRGVCGTSAAQAKSVVVPDVRAFPGHIACDAGSLSEIVIPILSSSGVVAVLDVDSYSLSAFDETDRIHLERLCRVLAPMFESAQIAK
jgi:L-methionine (R)-S-oxide reductase